MNNALLDFYKSGVRGEQLHDGVPAGSDIHQVWSLGQRHRQEYQDLLAKITRRGRRARQFGGRRRQDLPGQL